MAGIGDITNPGPMLRRGAVLALLAVAMTGIGSLASNSGCDWQVRDMTTGEWRNATPQEVTGFVNQTGELAKTAIVASPLAPFMPFIDIAIRLAALWAAWRIVPAGKQPAALPLGKED